MSLESLLRVESLKKLFIYKSPLGKAKGYLRAVDGISFSINENSVFAIVGESGSGKSTVANLILRLIKPTEGRIYFKGHDIFSFKEKQLQQYRRAVQIIFQDPFASLNPRMRIMDILSEPFKIHRIAEKENIKDTVVQLIEKVGMSSDSLNKYPHEFSGGQRQRICIARALALSPELIVADEPLSALDVSIQAQILNLFQKIREENNISFIFISHDLNIVRYFSDEVAVMYLGKIVEKAKTEDIFSNPLHPYSRLLISSAPQIKIKKEMRQEKDALIEKNTTNDLSSSLKTPSGCSFHPRCPIRLDICDRVMPEMLCFSGRLIACHLYVEQISST